MRRLRTVVLALAALAPCIAAAQQPVSATDMSCAGAVTIRGTVAAAGPALGLTLVDGTALALADLILPGGDGALATALTARLAALAGAEIAAVPLGAADRHGRLPAMVAADGRWLQAALLAEGLAAVSPAAGTACLAGLRAAEGAARAAGRGLWQGGHIVRRADAADLVNSVPDLMIVEGVVVSVGDSDGRVYLNFGTDWSTDFTVMIPEGLAPGLAGLGIRPGMPGGLAVRVRGWVELRDGAYLELPGLPALEVLSEASGAR